MLLASDLKRLYSLQIKLIDTHPTGNTILIKLNGMYITRYKSLTEYRRVAAPIKAINILAYLLTYPEPLEHLYVY